MRCQPIKRFLVNICSKFNQPCLLCSAPGESATPLCLMCELELPWLLDGCRHCALPERGDPCPECLFGAPPFERVLAPLAYGFPVDALVTRFKHHGQWPLGRLLGSLLARHLAHAYHDGLARPHDLVPVPLSTRRLRQRGFNQARMLADWLGQALALPVRPDLLHRLRDTPAQQRLGASGREHNLHQAFAVVERAAVEGRHLALVDDVFTTGATARALARVLRDAGAARVDVYCVARTPKPGAP